MTRSLFLPRWGFALVALLGFLILSAALLLPRGPRLAQSEEQQLSGTMGQPEGLFFSRATSLREEQAPLVSGPGLRVLLLGSDSRGPTPYHGRPDTIMVLVLPEGSEEVGVISIPRDLLVEPEDAPPHRINETMAVARRLGEPSLARMKRVVSDTLSLPIDHTILVTLDGFVQVVDQLGGVGLDVPCAIDDNFIDPSSESGRRALAVDQGRQQLDGTTAALYIRSRHGRSDFGRARRQQAVLRALKARLLTEEGLSKLPALLGIARKTSRSDMSPLALSRLALSLSGRKYHQMRGVVLGYQETIGERTESGKSVLRLRPKAAEDKIAGLFTARPAGAPASARCPSRDVALRKNWGRSTQTTTGATVDSRGTPSTASATDRSGSGTNRGGLRKTRTFAHLAEERAREQ